MSKCRTCQKIPQPILIQCCSNNWIIGLGIVNLSSHLLTEFCHRIPRISRRERYTNTEIHHTSSALNHHVSEPWSNMDFNAAVYMLNFRPISKYRTDTTDASNYQMPITLPTCTRPRGWTQLPNSHSCLRARIIRVFRQSSSVTTFQTLNLQNPFQSNLHYLCCHSDDHEIPTNYLSLQSAEQRRPTESSLCTNTCHYSHLWIGLLALPSRRQNWKRNVKEGNLDEHHFSSWCRVKQRDKRKLG